MRGLRAAGALLVAALMSAGTVAQQATGSGERVRSVLDTPVEFTGPRDGAGEHPGLAEIRLGLFGPSNAAADGEGGLFRGALLAVEEINEAGGIAGIPVRLVARWSDDPWRGGARDMTRLVYEDSVWAVIGSINGDATHVAEQVITKARVPLLSPISADPTLTYVRIPWMYRLPPNDETQAEVIISDGLRALQSGRVGLITSTDHDGRVFAQTMRTRMSAAGLPPVFHLQLPPGLVDAEEVVGRAKRFAAEAIVVRVPPDQMRGIVTALAERQSRLPLLIPWIPELGSEDFLETHAGPVFVIQPFDLDPGEAITALARSFDDRFGVPLSAGAAYSYDAVHLIAHALESGRGGRADLRDALTAASGYRGVTGYIIWDNAGGNTARPVGKWVAGARVR